MECEGIEQVDIFKYVGSYVTKELNVSIVIATLAFCRALWTTEQISTKGTVFAMCQYSERKLRRLGKGQRVKRKRSKFEFTETWVE